MAGANGTPKVVANVASGNLLRQILVLDGVPGLIATAAQSENIGVVRKVVSLDDAVEKGYSLELEPFIYGILEQFYNELGGNMEFWILGAEDTMSLEQMCTVTNANGAKKLSAASKGKITLFGVCRNPSNLYDPGDGFIDVDVENAMISSKALGQYLQSINRPARFLIEGRVADVDAEPYEPNTATNGFAGVVLGNDKADGSGAIGLALGRLCKYAAHVKAGNGQNGALSITEAYIGNKAIEEFYPEELDALADAGYFLLHTREGSAGYYFGRDNMGTDDDTRILVHGRLLDKAQRITTATTTPFLETSIRITAEGKINDADADFIEKTVRQQILAGMSGQISDVAVNVPLDQNVIETSRLNIEVAILPLGYLTWIIVKLGLTKQLS